MKKNAVRGKIRGGEFWEYENKYVILQAVAVRATSYCPKPATDNITDSLTTECLRTANP